MDNFVSVQPTSQATNEYEIVIEQLLNEMAQLNEKMRDDRAEIDLLRAETDLLKAETRAVLSGMGIRL